MPAKDPIQALDRYWEQIEEAAENHIPALRPATVDVLFAFSALMIGSQPAAAQDSGELDQLVSLLQNLADLMQRVGLALAVIGLSAAGLAYMLNKPGLAKRIAQNTIIGTLILLFSGAAVDYLASGL